MGAMRQLSITLPEDLAERVRAKVSSGEYANESEVIVEGLLALHDRDLSIEDWLREEAGPIHDAMVADPASGLSSEEVKAALARDRAARWANLGLSGHILPRGPSTFDRD